MNNQDIYLKLLICLALYFFDQYSLNAQILPDEVRIDYSAVNKPLSLVLKEISRKANIQINLSENRIPENKKITIYARNRKVGNLLDEIFESTRLEYEIIGNQIVIVRKLHKESQRNVTISGYVKDKISGENLVYANVYLFDKSKGTQTNEEGFFSLTISKGTQRIYFSYIGYDLIIKEFYLTENKEETVYLTPDVQLNEVIILEDVENREEETTASEENLYVSEILNSSTLGGESDVIRLVNMMAGVNSGADGLGGMNVRGGSADQNLVILDGVSIYNPGHAIGLFSIFNSDVIKNAKLIKGNIPARYGGRLSSILDVRTRDGSVNKFAGGVSLSTLALKGFFEGPIGKKGSSFLISTRRTFLDPWIKSMTEYINQLNEKDGFTTYYFLDFNTKINLKLNDKNTLLISSIISKDDFNNNLNTYIEDTQSTEDYSEVAWDWGNNVFYLKLKSQLSNKAFGTLTFSYTNFNFESFDFDSFYTLDDTTSYVYKGGLFRSNIRDRNVNYALDMMINSSNRIKMGVGYTHHTFSPGLNAINNSDDLFEYGDIINPGLIRNKFQLSEIVSKELNGYIENNISFSYNFNLNVGFHFNSIIAQEKSYFAIQPRIALMSRSLNTYFKIGASRMNQFLHLLSNNGLGFPSDVWLPSTDKLSPEDSWIFSSEFGYKNKNGIQWGAEAYYKILNNLTNISEGGSINISVDNNWEDDIPRGKGRSYGIEFYLNKIIGRTSWNANYTISWANYQFEDLNLGNQFPFRYDRRHSIKLGFFHKLTDNTEFVLNWVYTSGNPITYPTEFTIENEGEIILIYQEKNNRLLAPYHRLDFAFNFYSKLKWARQKFSLGLYNVFNRQNKLFIDITRNPNNSIGFEETSFSILPIFPSISYSLYFN